VVNNFSWPPFPFVVHDHDDGRHGGELRPSASPPARSHLLLFLRGFGRGIHRSQTGRRHSQQVKKYKFIRKCTHFSQLVRLLGRSLPKIKDLGREEPGLPSGFVLFHLDRGEEHLSSGVLQLFRQTHCLRIAHSHLFLPKFQPGIPGQTQLRLQQGVKRRLKLNKIFFSSSGMESAT